MTHKMSKNDPLFYKKAFQRLIDEAKENGIIITLDKDRIIIKDHIEFMGEIVSNTVCSIKLDSQ